MSLVGESLPDRFPIFPLKGALLLPGGNLPLNIFEPRYLAMVRDAVRTDRVIGMIQPREPVPGTAKTVPDEPAPPIYDVGCAGRITNFSETDDGRILITLTGLSRFDVAQELQVTTPYRQVVGRFDRWRHDCEPEDPPPHLKGELLQVLRRYFDLQGIEADWKAIKDAPMVPLVISLAMICPFGAAEKQGLLEGPTITDQAELLIALMEMDVRAASATDSGICH
jgi:Lon protease-like protein